MPPIQTDGAFEDGGLDATADAFAKLWTKDAPELSDDSEHEDDRRKPEEDEEEADASKEADDEGSEQEDAPETDEEGEPEEEDNDAKVVVKDDYKVKVQVDGEEREVSIGSLKRLAGQEASLTRKSQEVAQHRKTIDAVATTQAAAIEKMLTRARTAFEPYAKMDFALLAKDPTVSAEEFSAIRDMANKAYADVKFFEQEMGTLHSELTQRQETELRTQAAEAVKVLSDPKTGIEGWGEKLYGDIRSFATEQGIHEDVINRLVDPAAIKLIHKAMLYERGKQKVVQTAKTKPSKSPKKIVKSITNSDESRKAISRNAPDDARKRLKREGSTEAAADAFLARWAAE